jgi:hypothetical protein
MLEVKDLKQFDNQKTDERWSNAQVLELWKHFAGSGGADKNTMVTVSSWLLTFSATIIGYIVTQLVKPNSFVFNEPWKVFGLAILGTLISFVAGYVALLYGGYAKRNWAKADEIARACGRDDLAPDYSNAKRKESKSDKLWWVPAIATKLAEPCDPRKTVAPVFLLFAALGFSVFVAHLVFVTMSLSQILRK